MITRGMYATVVSALTITFPRPAVASEPSVGVLPVIVEGNKKKHVAARFTDRINDALATDTFVQVEMPEGEPGACADEACHRDLAASTGATHLVQAHVTVEGRDYTMRLDLIDGATGEVVRTATSDCEICTYKEAAERLGFETAATRGALEEAVVGTLRDDPEGPVIDVAAERAQVRAQARSKARRVAGWSLLGVGLGAAGAGTALVIIDGNDYKPLCTEEFNPGGGDCGFRHRTTAGGATLIALGAAAMAGGIALVVVDRKKTKKTRKNEKNESRADLSIGPRAATLRVKF